MTEAETIREARARDAARYERDCAEFKRLLATGDIDAARALVSSSEFRDAIGAAISEEVVAAVKAVKAEGITMSAAHIHALAGHANALLAHRWALICAGVAKARIDQLEKRLAEVESKGIQYRGVFQRSDSYARGDLVTHDGGIWHATGPTRQIPGAGDDWQLAVKAARPSR